MKKNMGGLDRAIRFIIAIGVGLLFYFGVIEGTLAYIAMTLAVVFLVTSFINFCPLYALFGINSCNVKK
ncbi:DUF2892 domain-containing protein [Flagellimonas sp. HMM57]|nr:DUF2892 domain-containing protein [Flagellimonas sp. HMM57]UII77957.1 DUF2892 domain-containing protein [Flagellimonas sp. HMM57]